MSADRFYRVRTNRDEGERLDRIAKAIYGTEKGGALEAMLDGNPGLAERGPFVPDGGLVKIVDRPPPPAETDLTRPWE